MTAVEAPAGIDLIALEDAHVAHNYHPLDVVVAEGSGATVVDTAGREYLDFLAAYSATNFGHRHPVLVEAARRQLDRLTLTSRAFHSDRLAPFAVALADLIGKDMVLPMNTGAEAVESGIKVARKWVTTSRACPRDTPRLSWPPATSTAAPRPSSASPMIQRPGEDSAPTRLASSPSRTGISRPSGQC